jgi:branched-subunit amino acid aminotransferase/4-amino-4-deoxychorismate lyase
VKSTSRADHVYGRLEAERRDADEALFLTTDGFVAEATSANVFVVAGGDLATPGRSSGILAGTTRSWLLGHAGAEGLRPVERDLGVGDVVGADEAFLSSSVMGIVPLVSVDRRPIGSGRPGPRTIALREARERWIDERSLAAVEAAS